MTSLRKRRNTGFKPNPYVVFADLAISLFFISTIVGFSYMVANSQALAAALRSDRQIKLCDRLIENLKPEYPNSEKRAVKGKHYVLFEKGSKPEKMDAEIWVNANYLRIQIMQSLWQRGTSQLDQERATKIYSTVVQGIRPDVAQFSYIYTHGIVSPDEGLSEPDAVGISRKRADMIYQMLVRLGIVGPISSPSSKVSSKGPCVPAQFAVAFGTGSTLYTNEQPIGRVDILLFFTDESGNKQ